MTSGKFHLEREAWMEFAVCKDADPNLFILEQGYTAAEAKKYCIRCPVREPCRDFAIKTSSVGVWGGVLFQFKTDERVLYPIQPLYSIIKPEPVSDTDRKVMPAILGRQAANFRKDTGINGSKESLDEP